MRHLFIINPAAGKKNSTAALERHLSTLSFEHEVVYTKEAGDAERITRAAALTGEDLRIYACGGDGTLNEVVNGAAGYDNVAITCVPKGTGNDFLKIFGNDYRKQFYDLEALAEGPQTPFDLMDCNGHLGIDVVCSGVDARIAEGESSLDDVIAMIEKFSEKERIVVAFDEFQEVLKLDHPDLVLAKLRSRIQFLSDTCFIF